VFGSMQMSDERCTARTSNNIAQSILRTRLSPLISWPVPNYERQLDCQIWSLDGRLVARTRGAPDTSLSDSKAGFSERLITRHMAAFSRWKLQEKGYVYSSATGWESGSNCPRRPYQGLLAPTALIIPLLGLSLSGRASIALAKTLRLMALSFNGRNADDMSRIRAGRVPTEIRPSSRHLMDCSRRLRAPPART